MEVAPPSMCSVELTAVTREFDMVGILRPLTRTLEPGSFTALVGPSGCGKTTLLRLIGGLDAPSTGRVTRSAGGVGFCFQEPRLLAWRTVVENVALPLELAGMPRARRLARAREALHLVQLDEAAARFPHQLSGGMKMRASLARALVARGEETAEFRLGDPVELQPHRRRRGRRGTLAWRRRGRTPVASADDGECREESEDRAGSR